MAQRNLRPKIASIISYLSRFSSVEDRSSLARLEENSNRFEDPSTRMPPNICQKIQPSIHFTKKKREKEKEKDGKNEVEDRR